MKKVNLQNLLHIVAMIAIVFATIDMVAAPKTAQAQSQAIEYIDSVGTACDTLSVSHATYKGTVALYISNRDASDTLTVTLEADTLGVMQIYPTKDVSFGLVKAGWIRIKGSAANTAYLVRAWGQWHP